MKRRKAYLWYGRGVAVLVLAGLLSPAVIRGGDGEKEATRETSQGKAPTSTDETAQIATKEDTPGAQQPLEEPENFESEAEAEILDHLLEAWTGDLDGMVERGFVRLVTTRNPL